MASIKKIKKKFFEIEVPELKQKIKAYTFNLESLNNRTVKLDLTRILRGKSIEANIKISVDKEKAEGEIKKLSLLQFYIRRAMRKSTSYIEDSFLAECKDNQLKIKPFMITRKKVSREVKKALRKNSKQFLIEYVKNEDSRKIFEEIISGKLQKTLSQKMKKIYPLAFCEIRQIAIIKSTENP